MAHWAEAEDLLLHHLRKRIRLKEHENIVWEALEWTKEEVDPDQFPEQVWERLPETFVVATTVVFSHHGKLWTIHMLEEEAQKRYTGWAIDTREDRMTDTFVIGWVQASWQIEKET